MQIELSSLRDMADKVAFGANFGLRVSLVALLETS